MAVSSALRCYLKEMSSCSPKVPDPAEAARSPEQLVLSNLRFVVRIAREFKDRGVPFEDLLNEGNIGLIHAASRYDPGRGVRFTSYAAWWIRKSMRVALDEQASTIRVPEYQRRKAAKLRADGGSAGAVAAGGPHQPPRLQLVSLDDTGANNGHGPLGETLKDQRALDPIRQIIHQEMRAGLSRGLARLSRTERRVIEGRFGLEDEVRLTLQEIGSVLGLSRERVRQIEVAARHKLRDYLTGEAE